MPATCKSRQKITRPSPKSIGSSVNVPSGAAKILDSPTPPATDTLFFLATSTPSAPISRCRVLLETLFRCAIARKIRHDRPSHRTQRIRLFALLPAVSFRHLPLDALPAIRLPRLPIVGIGLWFALVW